MFGSLIRGFRQPLGIVGLSSLLILSSCSTPPVVLQGGVIDAYTGEPIDGASILIGESDLATDATGIFNTTGWTSEDTLAISAPGYEPLSIALASRPEVAATDQQTITLQTTLRPNTLSGNLIDSYSGEPLAGAQIEVTDGLSITLSTTSDASGAYQLDGVPEAFTLTVSAADYAPISQALSRVTGFDSELRPNTISGQLTDRYSGQPLAGVTVAAGGVSAVSDAAGNYQLEDLPEGVTLIEFEADGYAPLSQQIDRMTRVDAVLRADTLRGRLVDANSGEPIINATIFASATYPGTDVAFVKMMESADGSFTLNGMPESGFLQILAPGYAKQVIPIEPGQVPNEFALDRFAVKSLYITAAVASVPRLVEEYFELIETTELNAIVIDLKSDLRDDLGLVYYDSQVPLVKELGTSADYIDMQALVNEAKARGIYTIARIQLFSHDNALADARPEWAIQDLETGEPYSDFPGPGIRYTWLDATNRNVWDYNIQLGVEAALMGFDEINYDYVRFPDWYGPLSTFNQRLGFSIPLDPVNEPEVMFENQVEFLRQAHRAMNGAGAFMSIDLFGRVSLGDSLTIAQSLSRMGPHADYLATMPYPSLWWSGIFGAEVPVREPYKILYGSTEAALAQLGPTSYGRLRPWLQDHTDPWAPVVVQYGPAEVRAQIDAVEALSPDGWMLYDSANAYRGAFGGAVLPEN